MCMTPHAWIHSATAGQSWWGSRGSLGGSSNLLHMHQYIMSKRCSAGFRSEEWEGRSEALPPKAVWPQEGRHRLHQNGYSKGFNVVPKSGPSEDTDLENLPPWKPCDNCSGTSRALLWMLINVRCVPNERRFCQRNKHTRAAPWHGGAS